MFKLEFVGKGTIEVGGLGELKKGELLQCTKSIAEEFSGDKRFKVYGFSEVKMPTMKGVKQNGK